MSYQALARQFRPQNFIELVGQEHVSQALINGLEQGRIHHAFLFTGTRGVGKTTIARILAKALNCEKGVTGSPCGSCSPCQEIAEGRFVDLIEVDAASRTGVDDTRELLDNVQYAPTSGRYKIYLIDEVHMFSKSSFNALLKTLEEPPPHVKFLLATTEPKKLPVTVLSRCLQFNLKRLSLRQITEHLIKLLDLQNIEYDKVAVELIARAADGSMRDGLSLLDQSIAFGAGSVKDDDVKLMLGSIDQNRVVALLSNIIAQDAQQLSQELQQIFMLAPDYARFLKDMALLLHEVSLYQILNHTIDNSSFTRQDVTEIAKNTSPEQIQLFYQITTKGQDELNLAPDRKTGFEMTIIRLFAFKIGSPLATQKKTKNNITTDNSTIPTNLQTVATPIPPVSAVQKPIVNNATSQQQNIQLQDINNKNWHNIFKQLPLQGTARELARNAQVIENKNGHIVLAIDKRAETFMTEKACDRLKQAIENLVPATISVTLQHGEQSISTIASQQQHEQDTDVQTTKQKVATNQFVQHMQANFDAEVIQIKQGEDFI